MEETFDLPCRCILVLKLLKPVDTALATIQIPLGTLVIGRLCVAKHFGFIDFGSHYTCSQGLSRDNITSNYSRSAGSVSINAIAKGLRGDLSAKDRPQRSESFVAMMRGPTRYQRREIHSY